MFSHHIRLRILGTIAGALFLGMATSYLSSAVIVAVTCGGAKATLNMGAGWATWGGRGGAFGHPECSVDATPSMIATLVVAILTIAAMVYGFIRMDAYRRSDRYFRKDLLSRQGLATRREVRDHFADRPRQRAAATLRPRMSAPTANDVSIVAGHADGQPVRLSIEDSVLVEGAPRLGKGFRFLIGEIIDAPGSVITTSTRTDNVAATWGPRSRLGRCTLFDPQGIAGMTEPLRINPVAGCEDPMVATQRGAAILGGTALGASSTNGEWADEAARILAYLLQAAAISGQGVDALARWGASPKAARQAVEVLDREGAPGWGDGLEATLDDDPKLLSSKWFGVSSAIAPLHIPTIRETMRPGDGEQFDVERFLEGRNTLYLVGTRSGAGACGGFLAAVLDDIVEQARRRALSLPGGRLDPPLALILDEIANMFSWKALPTIMSDGGGIGISATVVLQALSQAESAWSRAEMDTVWGSSNAKLLLGGGTSAAHLADLEALIGTREEVRTSYSEGSGYHSGSSQESMERVPIISRDELRRLPEGIALLLYKNRRAVLLEQAGWIDRPDAEDIRQSIATFNARSQEVRP